MATAQRRPTRPLATGPTNARLVTPLPLVGRGRGGGRPSGCSTTAIALKRPRARRNWPGAEAQAGRRCARTTRPGPDPGPPDQGAAAVARGPGSRPGRVSLHRDKAPVRPETESMATAQRRPTHPLAAGPTNARLVTPLPLVRRGRGGGRARIRRHPPRPLRARGRVQGETGRALRRPGQTLFPSPSWPRPSPRPRGPVQPSRRWPQRPPASARPPLGGRYSPARAGAGLCCAG